MSPRKSSTSSGRRAHPRPRYLGLEVAGEHLPPLTPRGWEALLRAPSSVGPPFRLVRTEAARAIVEVEHTAVARAREAWNRALPDSAGSLATVRSWGTLVGAKRWLRAPRGPV